MKSRTKKELRLAYNISAPTLAAWIKRLPGKKNKNSKILWPSELIRIYIKYGNPFTDERERKN